MAEKSRPKHLHVGWEYFTPDPGKHDKMFCRVCKSEMEVERNVMGPTGWAEAMGKHGHLHDTFTCPIAGEDWHNQARVLLERIQHESSCTIVKLLKKEVKEILKNRKTTMKRGWEYL